MGEIVEFQSNGSSGKTPATGASAKRGRKWKVPLEVHQLCEILPHRPPFLFVDRITKLNAQCARGTKEVTNNEPYIQRLPGSRPTYPPTLVLESMCQVGAVLALTSTKTEGCLPNVVSVEAAKFHRPVYPGERLHIEVNMIRLHSKYGKFRGVAKVNGKLVAETDIICTIPQDDRSAPREEME